MLFDLTDLAFLYLFLPLSAGAYYLVPRRAKVPVLFFVSVAFCALAQPQTLWMLLAAVTVDYGLAAALEAAGGRQRLRRFLMLFVVFKNASVILISSVLAQLAGERAPLGLAVYCFTAIGYVVDLYRGQAQFERDFFRFGVFGLLYCKAIAGPLVRWGELHEQLEDPRPSLSRIADGAVLYVQGMAKRLIIGQNMQQLYEQLRATGLSEQTVLSAWLLTLSLAFSVIFTLTGYCDMARGLAGIYSLQLPRNFDQPFLAASVTNFTTRFNITVRRFFETYVYDPLGGSTRGGLSTLLNMTLLMLLWGSWFGYSVNYILWGAYFKLLLLAEQWVLGRYLEKIPLFFARAYTYIAVMMSFVIFAGSGSWGALGYYRLMFGMTGAALYDDHTLYLLLSNYVALLLALLLSTSLIQRAWQKLCDRYATAGQVLGVLTNAGLLAVVTILQAA